MSVVIKIENISKQYRLGIISTNTLKGDFQRWWYRMKGLPDPALKIGQENQINSATLPENEYVWALKDINFEVKQGEVLGIIGKNGAGKSTLLKLLSRVTAPTTGLIKVKGRIASLLEVGTGFHPELTGKENIFLNGAILGMTKNEINRKFDEIVDFSGVERYIDTPVKRYSSGMYVRLAFAVAAHLEPEILIVDEVLAVGDAEFQKKALGKMQTVSQNQGRTVLFVSHNIAAVKSLCKMAIILKNGNLTEYEKTPIVIEHYLENNSQTQAEYVIPQNRRNVFAYVERVCILSKNLEPTYKIPLLEPFAIKIQIRVEQYLPHFIIGVGFTSLDDIALKTTHSKPMDIEKGVYEVLFSENITQFTSGKYKVLFGITSRETVIQYLDDIVILEIDDIYSKDSIISTKAGYFLNKMDVKITKINVFS